MREKTETARAGNSFKHLALSERKRVVARRSRGDQGGKGFVLAVLFKTRRSTSKCM